MSYRQDVAGVSEEGRRNLNGLLGDNVRLNCNTGGAGPLQVTDHLLEHSIAIVDTTINTCGMRRPSILLSFTAIISLPEGSSASLIFQIRRSMNSGPSIRIGSPFVFADEAESLESKSFAFQYFDTHLQPGVYTYSVELTSNSDISGVSGLTILNATLCVLAID